MNGLRIYTKPNGSANLGTIEVDRIFYSRRGNGPYYRWRYEDIIGQWRVSRVITPDFNTHSLMVSTWKAVPVSLRTRLSQHYME
jgi:hypothetical protein